MTERIIFQKSTMLEELFGKTRWQRSAEIANLILRHYYPHVNLQIQLSAADVINTIKSSSLSGLFTASMNALQTDILYKSRLHGQSHIERTAVLCAFLALHLDFSEREFFLCLETAKYHDAGRTREGKEPAHGRYGAQKIEAVYRACTQEEQNLLKAVITAHCLPDKEELLIFQQYCRNDIISCRTFRRMIRILKDADALDRFRLSCHGPDIRYLRLKESQKLLLAACEMVNS